MFIIKKTTKAGTENTGIECVTINEAKAECVARTEGKVPASDDEDGDYFRLEVYEVLDNGDLDQVYATDCFEE